MPRSSAEKVFQCGRGSTVEVAAKQCRRGTGIECGGDGVKGDHSFDGGRFWTAALRGEVYYGELGGSRIWCAKPDKKGIARLKRRRGVGDGLGLQKSRVFMNQHGAVNSSVVGAVEENWTPRTGRTKGGIFHQVEENALVFNLHQGNDVRRGGGGLNGEP